MLIVFLFFSNYCFGSDKEVQHSGSRAGSLWPSGNMRTLTKMKLLSSVVMLINLF